jgi:hydroxypyruvate reductase
VDITNFLNNSIRAKPWGLKVARIMAAGVRAVDPRSAVLNNVRRINDSVEINGEYYDLSLSGRTLLIGAGKAGQPMAEAVSEILGKYLEKGLVIVKDGYLDVSNPIDRIEIIEAGHPIPDQRGVAATDRIINLLNHTQRDDLVICLISGGGSALMVSPVDGVSVADLQTLTAELLASGATINEINTLRKHLDHVKGGQIARYAAPARLISLIMSDVVGDPLDVVASGPTVPDSTTFNEALNILTKYQIDDRISKSIIKHLNSGSAGEIPETPKYGDDIFKSVSNYVIGSNQAAGQGALLQAQKEGFHTMMLTNYLQGEAKEVAKVLAAILRQVASKNQPLPRPACIILGGETTVTLQGNGLGGRNQELALASIHDLAGIQDIALITMATDGGDGPTDAAGAIVTGETMQKAQESGLNPQVYLKNNDSNNFFKALDDLLIIGPTQTNVNDIVFLFAF